MARGPVTAPAFELLRFAVVAEGADAALLELEGRWRPAPPPAGRARLLSDAEGLPARGLPPASEAVEGEHWRASFAASPAVVAGALGVAARGVVVDLPAPDPPDPEEERLARLARQGNALRRRLDMAEARADEADRLAAEVAALRADLAATGDEAEWRAGVAQAQAESHAAEVERHAAEVEALVQRHAVEVRSGDERRDAELRTRDEEHAAEVGALRAELRS